MFRKGKTKSKGKGIAPIPIVPWRGQPIADAFKAAIASQDWDAARAAYAQMPTWNDRKGCVSSVDLDEATFAALTNWISQTQGQDPLPYLTRGAGGVAWAWEARGAGWSDTVTQAGWKLFFERLRTADQDLHRAARLDPQNPNPWVGLLPVSMGLQVPQAERDLRFEQAFRRDPTNIAAHLSYVQCIAEKWSGDDERMWQFAKDVHAGVPAGSPLRVVVASAMQELVMSNERAEGAPPHDTKAAAELVLEAINQSALHPDFATHDWSDQRAAVMSFLTTLYEINMKGGIEIGAKLIPLLRNSPPIPSLEYIPGETDEHKWATLCNHFGHSPATPAQAA